MKKLLISLIVLVVILILTPVFSFFINHEFWSHFQEYMRVILAPLIAAFGIMATISLNFLSQRNIEKQRMLQRPLLFLRRIDFENHIQLILKNKGLGPLVVTSLVFKDSKGEKYKGVFAAIEDMNLTSDTYTGDMDGLVLSANEEKILFNFTEACPDFEKARIRIKERFSDLEIIVNYKDIYEEKMPEYRCKLNWYGRDLKK